MVPLQISSLSALLIIDSIILLLLHRCLLPHRQLQLHQVIPPLLLLLELYCCFLPLQFCLLKIFPLRHLVPHSFQCLPSCVLSTKKELALKIRQTTFTSFCFACRYTSIVVQSVLIFDVIC